MPTVADDRELLRFRTEDGAEILVEVSADEPGFQKVSRARDAITDARQSFEDSLSRIRTAATRTLATFRDDVLNPDGVEVEFGLRFNAEAGAVIAKTAVEGHMLVRLTWNSPNGRAADGS